jgi:hypothetical protein
VVAEEELQGSFARRLQFPRSPSTAWSPGALEMSAESGGM